MSMKWARDMTDAALDAELANVTADLADLIYAPADDIEHGGSPLEGIYERLDEVEGERLRRQAKRAAWP